MIIETAQNLAALSITAGLGYAAFKSCEAVEQKDPTLKMYKPGKWVRRAQWSARYIGPTVIAVLILPVGMIMGGDCVREMKDEKGKKLVLF